MDNRKIHFSREQSSPNDSLLTPIQKEVLNCGRFVTLENSKEKETYAWFLGYSLVKALYELYTEASSEGISWDTCRHIVHCDNQHQAKTVLSIALSRFVGEDKFVFNATVPEFFEEIEPGEKDGFIQSALPLSMDIMCSIIDWLMLRAEISQYSRLRSQGNICSWNQYIDTLMTKEKLWSSLRRGFQNALSEVNFTEAWIEVANKTIDHFGFCENAESGNAGTDKN